MAFRKSQPTGARHASFEALVRPHLERLYRFAYRLTGSRDAAEDLVQELCVKIFPLVEQLRHVDDPASWLSRSLYNHFIDGVRHQSRSPVDYQDELPEIPSNEPGPEAEALRRADAQQIYAALARLSPEHRAVVVWHDLEGYTLEELSADQDVALGTLKSRLHRARAQLRTLLMEPFSAPERVEGYR